MGGNLDEGIFDKNEAIIMSMTKEERLRPSIINGQRFDWQERDIFCVPSWAWHEHVNASQTDDACLFCFSDLPVMEKLALFREEALTDGGGHQSVIAQG